MELAPENLLGTWALVSYRIEMSQGSVAEPFGSDPVGELHYAADGFMAAHIMRRGRTRLGDTVAADGDAARRALASHFSYCGRYSIRGDQVKHDVTVSVSPDWCGTTVMRTAVLEGDRMTLRAPGTRFGAETGQAVLVWRRMPTGT